MPKKFGVSPFDPLETYPDPFSEAKRAAKISRLTDKALAEDMPASRLFSTIPTAVARDVRQDTEGEREALSAKDPSPRS